MTDLMRQWNESVEEFDQLTQYRFDHCDSITIIDLAWRLEVFDLADRLNRTYLLLQKSVDSPTVKVGGAST